MNIAVFRNKIDIDFTISLELNGGTCDVSEIAATCGGKYNLPQAVKPNYAFDGWYSDPSFTNKLSNSDNVDYNIRTIYAKWIEFTNYTSFEVTTTSSYKEFGFYSATKKSSSENIYIDWGDGTIEVIPSISAKYHTYSNSGTYIVKVSDDITSLQVSSNLSTNYAKIRYTLKKVLTWSTSITALTNYCFYYASSMTDIYANLDNITSIGAYCFYQCTSLGDFDFLMSMSKIRSIPNYCFYNCTYFTSLDVIPSSVTSYGSYAFFGCRIADLSKIRASDTLSTYCFSLNTTLVSVETLKPRTSLPQGIFNGCINLTTANLSNWTSLTSIPGYAFYNCSNLTSISLPPRITSIGSYAFSATKISMVDWSSLTSLTTISSYAFINIASLTSIILPSSVTTIGDSAFSGCANLTSISSYAEGAPNVGSATFGNSASTYTGYNNASSNTNTLRVPIPKNYKTSYWQSVLLEPTKCNFKVVPFDAYSAAGFDIQGIDKNYLYTGSPITPLPVIINSDGNTLTLGVDYNVSYSNNTNCGIATITISGIGSYHDSVDIEFRIYDPSQYSLSVNLNSQWRIPQQWTNTNENYDVYESFSNYNTSNGYAKMFITVSGFIEFTIYINSYAESNYDYTLAFVPDYEPTYNPSGTSVSGNVKGTTYGYQYNPSSYGIESGSGWKRVDYVLDGGEHTICICFRKDGSVNSNWDRGYVAIPKI